VRAVGGSARERFDEAVESGGLVHDALREVQLLLEELEVV
jgi:hypothetical protein